MNSARRVRFTLFALLPLALAASAAAVAPQEPPPDFKIQGDAARAAAVYHERCAVCHGDKGDGQSLMAKYLDPKPTDFTDAKYMATRSDWQLYLTIKGGGKVVGLSEKMSAFGPYLSDQQLQDLVLYVRQFAAASR
jgi:mono/diheme cytochrome c family protein